MCTYRSIHIIEICEILSEPLRPDTVVEYLWFAIETNPLIREAGSTKSAGVHDGHVLRHVELVQATHVT